MAVHIRRREFIGTLGSAIAAWPFAARAQQPAMPLVGYLHSASPEPYAPMMAAFRQGLKETSYVEGQNVALEFRWAEGRPERLPALAAELVRRQVAVLATGGGDPPAGGEAGVHNDSDRVRLGRDEPTSNGVTRHRSEPLT